MISSILASINLIKFYMISRTWKCKICCIEFCDIKIPIRCFNHTSIISVENQLSINICSFTSCSQFNCFFFVIPNYRSGWTQRYNIWFIIESDSSWSSFHLLIILLNVMILIRLTCLNSWICIFCVWVIKCPSGIKFTLSFKV